MRVSVELVPRGVDVLCEELAIVRGFPAVDTVNVPDLLRFPLRSWEACRTAQTFLPRAVPHLRAIDYDLSSQDGSLHGIGPLCATLAAHGMREVLVVTGDPPSDGERTAFPTRPETLIRALKAALPDLTVYAGLDPYRAGFRDELEYARRKREAGADGLFTQPFFDPRLMDLYADLLDGETVFWGISPVLTARSRAYWEERNRALFPRDFTPTLEWNVAFARRTLEFVRVGGWHIYLMPIRVDLRAYLSGVFALGG